MLTTTTIQAEIERYMQREGLTISRFAQKAVLNSGTVSNILRGNRFVAIGQLDKITAAMGLPEGTYYELFFKECMESPALDWRRLGPFMDRCAELDKLELMQSAARCFMDNLAYASHLFEMAEYWFRENKWSVAAILYQTVAESEKYQHSERLALCQYRLFKITLGDDQDVNLRAATRFEPYVERLEVVDQLDALKILVDIYSSVHHYDKVDLLAVELGNKAQIHYNLKHSSTHLNNRSNQSFREPSMALFGYILYSYLMRGVVCEARGQIEQAAHYASLYDNPHWVKETDEVSLRALEKFHFWATANRQLYKVVAGEKSLVTEYIEYVASGEDELFFGLFPLIIAANKYNWDIADVLNRYKEEIEGACTYGPQTTYNKQVMNNDFAFFLSDLAVYHLNRQKYSVGLSWLLKGLTYSLKINNEACIIRCISLFEQYRNEASFEEQQIFKNTIKEVQKQNEKKIASFGRII